MVAYAQKQQKKSGSLLVWLCSIVYFISYVTRIDYQAIISELVSAEGIGKDMASLAVTGLFITYGTGQIVCGILGDRVKPENIIFTGLLTSTLMNLLLPISTNTVYMTAVWCINGFAQAMMWPPLVKIMSTYLDDYAYSKACVKVSFGSSAGTIMVYCLSSFFAAIHNWRLIFYTASLLGVFGIFLWRIGFRNVKRSLEANGQEQIADEAAETRPFILKKWILIIGMIMLAIVLQGTLRDGITTWMPSYIKETYGLDTSNAIISSIALPIFSIFSFQIAQLIHRKYLKNELICAGVIFSVATVSTMLLALLFNKSAVLAVVLNMLIVGSMHGVNLILICMVPKKFKPYGNISTMSGILNFSTYVGSAASTYGFAAISESAGWQTTIVIWAAIAALGMVLCFAGASKWHKLSDAKRGV